MQILFYQQFYYWQKKPGQYCVSSNDKWASLNKTYGDSYYKDIWSFVTKNIYCCNFAFTDAFFKQ